MGYQTVKYYMSSEGTYYGYHIGETVLWLHENKRVKIRGWWKPGRVVVTGGHILYLPQAIRHITGGKR